MDEGIIIDQLEELAERFGLQICYEAINLDEEAAYVAGGLCQLRGEYLIIINSRLTIKERIETLARALKHFDLDQVYTKPAIRELLNRIPATFVRPNATE
ncbi:MAG: hypothetical protein LAN71_16835 [Acidobacteriia bacterium]|nr:hypothetical protein [Terriglobia bacterium]